MKILTVLGARPQFIKAAVVSRSLLEHTSGIKEEIIHTGQHYNYSMSQIFFDEMNIPMPSVNLHIGGGSHGAATGEMLKKLEEEMLKRKPDYVLVYGDTNSTLAGALAASKLHIPIAHIEAGERSYNRKMPEEINRVLTDHVSNILFCCSEKGKKQLKQEGIVDEVHVVGDVMYDAFLNYLPKATWPKNVKEPTGEYVIVTLHRAQNTDDRKKLETIFNTLSQLPENIYLPLHPRTLKMIQNYDLKTASNINVFEPVSYFEMLALLKGCSFVMTDSGGVQKEAYYAGKKCITLREETEWTELVDKGANKVVGVNEQRILNARNWANEVSSLPKNIYGDGKAGLKIVDCLKEVVVPA